MKEQNEKSSVEQLKESLLYSKKSFYEVCPEKADAAYAYAAAYMRFLDASKTEREAVEEGIKLAKEQGYCEYRMGDRLQHGGKYYMNNRGKSLFLFRIGTENPENGVKILAAHIDSPRLDLKQRPLFEDGAMAFLKTHYYGGIRKYQWTAIPLSLHGVVMKNDGSSVRITIGEDDGDPVLYINDLLPHLSREQSKEPLATAIKGEQLNLLVGSRPVSAENGDGELKLNVMRILNEKYGITESDFCSAELSAVPIFKARDAGLDRSMIAAYGHDDRVCAYPSMTALFETANEKQTIITVLADKEEVGSDGNTGMQSYALLDLLSEIALQFGANERKLRASSFCLSSDVTAAYDPNFADVYEKRNSSLLGCGVSVAKYTGSAGKGSTNDASAETMGTLRRILDGAGVVWQTAELGKIDIGGGGTVAKYISKLNIDTIDIGVPVISMHAPCEIISKADLYTAHEAFLAFCDAE